VLRQAFALIEYHVQIVDVLVRQYSFHRLFIARGKPENLLDHKTASFASDFLNQYHPADYLIPYERALCPLYLQQIEIFYGKSLPAVIPR
jgi:hypothetical protein